MNDSILLPLIELFIVLWILVWVAEKVTISVRFLREMKCPDREAIECPNCGQITFAWNAEIVCSDTVLQEYICTECHHYATF